MGTASLRSEDRRFLSLVSEAAFANPFSLRRVELDRRIIGGRGHGQWPDIVPEVIEQVRSRLKTLERDGPCRIQDFPEQDQVLMAMVLLFVIFHKYGPSFCELIAEQMRAEGESVQVGFAKEALHDLRRCGLDEAMALRCFALLYQLQRAYYFINQGLVGQCPSMRRLREGLWNTIFTHDVHLYGQTLWDRMEDFSILLLGPTGAGKGAAAVAVGRSGFIPFDGKKGAFARSFTETFVSVNLSQYAQTLLESELFGHTKGAFTGAVTSHEGLLSRCGRHGSIFLDEIGDIGPAVQIKLLKVLEERTFTEVGGHDALRFEGRVIAATHRDLASLRREGRFRDDFYYRLCSDCIEVPGLVQRVQEDPKELDILIAHTVRRLIGQDLPQLCGIVREVIDLRLSPGYPWPGNVRELAQCVRRVILKNDYEADLVVPLPEGGYALAEQIQGGGLTAEQVLSLYCKLLYDRFGTYEEVARRADLDRRTARRYVHMGKPGLGP
ncbi:MAG: sigma 54-interacting transcriptional regulator [Phycisphaerae bacterium]|nr:sigma 54-interacting transcriptional regulator [Phycisphaerae bacterium]